MEQGHGFRLATKEKALLDTLYKIRSVTSKKDIDVLVFFDLRLETSPIHSTRERFIVPPLVV